ncbi:MAG: DoxX family protein [Gemmatimonadetes bacterium]|nr:DoxX family protein [Gemmatimonadota bacterium]
MLDEKGWAREWGMVPLRLVVGAVFFMHGWQKLFDFGLSGVSDMLQKLGFFLPTMFAAILIVVELAGAVSVLLGAFTRWAGLLLAIEMCVAIPVARWKGGFFTPYGYEFELVLLGASLTLFLLGAGGVSFDRWRAKGGAAAG